MLNDSSQRYDVTAHNVLEQGQPTTAMSAGIGSISRNCQRPSSRLRPLGIYMFFALHLSNSTKRWNPCFSAYRISARQAG